VVLVVAAVAIRIAYTQDRARQREIDQLRDTVNALQDRPAAPAPAPTIVTNVIAAPATAPAPSASQASADPAPAAPAAPAPQRTNQEIMDHYEISFTEQNADAAWAPGARHLAEQRLKATMPDGSEVRAIDCRTSLCRIETSHADMAHYQQFVRSALFDPTTSVWNAATYSSLVEDRDGHLVVVSYVSREGEPLPA